MKYHFHFAGLLAVLLVAPPGNCAEAAATSRPYKLTVVLDVAKNRVLTDVFRQQVERELGEGLQAALGELADVEVVREHPKLASVRANGLKVLSTWTEHSDAKTHFILIDFVGNQYVVQGRQYDGPTAMAGPAVRVDRTPDRAFVARTAALMIERDFGFTATFRSWPMIAELMRRQHVEQPQTVRLDLLGAGLGVPLSRWVQKDDVFLVVQMLDGGQTQPIEGALVQVQDAPRDDAPDGTCTGRVFWRRLNQFEDGRHVGYRCVKLGAGRYPVRLRFLEQRPDGTARPLTAGELSVEVRRRGFNGEETSVVKGPTRGGYFTTADRPNLEPYDRAAFVTVRSAGRVRALLPQPLVDEQTVVVVLSNVSDKSEELAERLERWRSRVSQAWLVQVGTFEELTELSHKADYPRDKIVARAKAGLKRTEDDCNTLDAEKADLLRDAGDKPPDLSRQEQTLKDLQGGVKQLEKFIENQQTVLADEGKPERRTARQQIVDAGLAEERADFGRAIDLYEKSVASFDVPEARERLKQLKRDWAVRDEEHRKARAFIYDKWPNLDTAGLEREMEAAKKALAECKRVHDRLSPRKLLLAANAHVARLEKEVKGLRPDINLDDEKPSQRIKKVADELERLIHETVDFLSAESKR